MTIFSISKPTTGTLVVCAFLISPSPATAYEDGVQIGEKPTAYQMHYALEQEAIALKPYHRYRAPAVVHEYLRNKRKHDRLRRERPHKRALRKYKNELVIFEYLTR